MPDKKWTCPICGPHNLRVLQARFWNGGLNPQWHLVLTLQTDDYTDIMEDLNRLKTSLCDDGYSIRYLNIKEFTRKGKRHLHIIGEGWLPYIEMSSRWKRATLGRSRIALVKTIHDKKHAVAYITKYMTKAILSSTFEKGEHRYSTSRGVLAPPLPPTGEWEADLTRRGLEWALPPQVPRKPLEGQAKGPPLHSREDTMWRARLEDLAYDKVPLWVYLCSALGIPVCSAHLS